MVAYDPCLWTKLTAFAIERVLVKENLPFHMYVLSAKQKLCLCMVGK